MRVRVSAVELWVVLVSVLPCGVQMPGKTSSLSSENFCSCSSE